MEPAEALTALLDRPAEASPSDVAVLLCDVAQPDERRLAPAVRRIAFSERPELAALSEIALSWLARRGLLEPGACDIVRLLGAHLDTAVALAAAAVPAATADHRHVEEQLQLVRAVAARAWPGAEQVLEIIGRDHPDATVGRAARKELFRLRTAATE